MFSAEFLTQFVDAQNSQKLFCVSYNEPNKYCLISREEYIHQKTLFGWNDQYRKLSLMELADAVQRTCSTLTNKLDLQIQGSHLERVDTDAFKDKLLEYQPTQQTLQAQMKVSVEKLTTMRTHACTKRTQRTDFLGKILQKIWSWWFDPQNTIEKLSRVAAGFHPIEDALKDRTLINMQSIEWIVNKQIGTTSVQSTKCIKTWLTEYAYDKLPKLYDKNKKAQNHLYKIMAFLELWNHLDNPKVE